MTPAPQVICEYCGRVESVMEDPTWSRETSLAPKPLRVCEPCAKELLERAMYKVVQ